MLVLRAGLGGVKFEELAFAPDGRGLAGGGHLGGFVCLWAALADGARADVISLPAGGGAVRPAFTPDGQTLFAGNEDIYALDLDSRRTARVPAAPRCGPFAVSPDGTRVVVSEYPRDGTGARVSCWSVPALGDPLWRVPVESLWSSGPLFLPDRPDRFARVEWVNNDGIQPWRGYWVTRALADGSVVATSDAVIEPPERTALSPDGAWLAATARDCIYRYPGSGRWTFVEKVGNDSRKHFTGVAFHPSGRYLAATSNDATVKLYDTTSWQVARTFTWDIGKMRSVAFSPDGALAAAGSGSGKVVVWDVDL